MKANVHMKNQWRLVVGIILILVIVIFAILNIEVVPINFGFTQLNSPLIIIIFISLLLGSLLTLLSATGSAAKQKKELKQLKKQLSEHDKELNAAVEKTKEEYELKIKDLQNQLNDKEEK